MDPVESRELLHELERMSRSDPIIHRAISLWHMGRFTEAQMVITIIRSQKQQIEKLMIALERKGPLPIILKPEE